MTARLPFTQATVRRAIAAARAEGLHVHGIRPDGTVIIGDKPSPGTTQTETAAHDAPPSKWEEVEA